MKLNGNPLSIKNLKFPQDAKILVLGPHPDDFDVISVTLQYLKKMGIPIFVSVATSGASGAEDSYCSPPTQALKAKLREEEQEESCRFFGLPDDNLNFLRLEEDEEGHPLINPANLSIIQNNFLKKSPTIVFLPYGKDTNLGHQRIYAMFHQIAHEAQKPLIAFLNRDPKTIEMRCDVYTAFDTEEATWKGKLLRFHMSQHQRNLNQRSHGFDQRILEMDQENAELYSLNHPYAEIFALAFFGGSKLYDFVVDDIGSSQP